MFKKLCDCDIAMAETILLKEKDVKVYVGMKETVFCVSKIGWPCMAKPVFLCDIVCVLW